MRWVVSQRVDGGPFQAGSYLLQVEERLVDRSRSLHRTKYLAKNSITPEQLTFTPNPMRATTQVVSSSTTTRTRTIQQHRQVPAGGNGSRSCCG
jgi:hypothetical protein